MTLLVHFEPQPQPLLSSVDQKYIVEACYLYNLGKKSNLTDTQH